jgi:hypothetical protein
MMQGYVDDDGAGLFGEQNISVTLRWIKRRGVPPYKLQDDS